ncbi:MAG: hypothetical protein ABR588_03580 [Sphingomicrobium sp.]|nr:hypothetical protein [Sphingomonadales bacterium]
MNVAGVSLEFLFGVGIVILGAVLLWATFRSSKRRSGEASVEASERATRDLYAHEEGRARSGTDTETD